MPNDDGDFKKPTTIMNDDCGDDKNDDDGRRKRQRDTTAKEGWQRCGGWGDDPLWGLTVLLAAAAASASVEFKRKKTFVCWPPLRAGRWFRCCYYFPLACCLLLLLFVAPFKKSELRRQRHFVAGAVAVAAVC